MIIELPPEYVAQATIPFFAMMHLRFLWTRKRYLRRLESNIQRAPPWLVIRFEQARLPRSDKPHERINVLIPWIFVERLGL
jgi:hypothetical protein